VRTSFTESIQRARRQRKALTILEMLVSTAMLSFIVLGLTAVFIQTQRAFKTGLKQTTVNDAGRTVMDMIANDLRQMADAQNSGVTNLYWAWAATNQFIQTNNGVPFRTNQVDEIYILERTNTAWMGVGYAVLNLAPGVGTLYRYEIVSNAPSITNDLFWPFYNSTINQTFPGQPSNAWHRVADGVIHLKLRAFDQNGNEPWFEAYYGDYSVNNEAFAYPAFYSPGPNIVPSNTLPNAVELELGILEPDTFAQARALSVNRTALINFLSTTAPKVDIFRQRISIPDVAR
jgi:hypothetical protein